MVVDLLKYARGLMNEKDIKKMKTYLGSRNDALMSRKVS